MSAPQAIPGLPRGLGDLSLAFDGEGLPVLAADGPGLVTARRAASGSWAIQQLGAGAQPQLAAGPAGSLLLLSAPADTVAHGQARQGPALRVLPRGGAWGAPLALAAAGQAIAGLALAVDPRTGAVHAAIQDGPVSRRRASLDPAMHLAALNLAPGGHLSVVPGSVRLNPPQPAPGARAALLVAVRNTGVTTRAAGSAALVRLSPGGTAIRLRTGAPLAPGATTTLRAMLIVPAAALQVVASAGGVAERATLALPPAPSGLGMTPRAAFRLVLDVPRARLSGNLAVLVPYSPPAVPAFSDGAGHLTDAAGHTDVRVTLPDDPAAGGGTISLLRQGGSDAVPVQQRLRRAVCPSRTPG